MNAWTPWDLSVERALVGCLLLTAGQCLDVVDDVEPDDLYGPATRAIWTAGARLHARGEPADLVSVASELRTMRALDAPVGGAAELARLTDALPSSANVEAYARRVRDLATVRRLAAAGDSIRVTTLAKAEAGEPVASLVDQAEAEVLGVTRNVRSKAVHALDAVAEVFQGVAAASAGNGVVGVPTGLSSLDDLLGGLRPGHLDILAGRPGTGKTALALNVAVAAGKAGHASYVASLEMLREELTRRMLASESRVDETRIRTGVLNPSEWERFHEAGTVVSRLPIWIDDTSAQSVLDVRAGARRVAREAEAKGTPLRLVVVDYLQLVRPLGRSRQQSREQDVSETSRGLKALAKQLGVAVLALSQLSRACEQRPDKRPMLSDLRESGQIEADADVVAFVFRPELYDDAANLRGLAEILVRKQRGGRVGTARARFFGEFLRFEALADDSYSGGAS